MGIGGEAGHRIVSNNLRDRVGCIRAVGPEPLRGPVQRAKKGARGNRRIGWRQRAGADTVGDQRAHAALVPIALGDDERAEAAGEGVDLEVRRGTFDFVDEAEDVRDRERAQPVGERAAAAPRLGERGQQAIERAVLAEIQQLVLAAEVVIEVRRRQVGGDGDVAHAGGGEAALAEHAGGSREDPDPARVGPL